MTWFGPVTSRKCRIVRMTSAAGQMGMGGAEVMAMPPRCVRGAGNSTSLMIERPRHRKQWLWGRRPGVALVQAFHGGFTEASDSGTSEAPIPGMDILREAMGAASSRNRRNSGGAAYYYQVFATAIPIATLLAQTVGRGSDCRVRRHRRARKWKNWAWTLCAGTGMNIHRKPIVRAQF